MPTQPLDPKAPPRPGRERRRWARAGADLPITVALDGGRSEARVRDISRAGVCFFLDRPIPLMTVLELAMDLHVKNGVRKIRGAGAVVRCEKIVRWRGSCTCRMSGLTTPRDATSAAFPSRFN